MDFNLIPELTAEQNIIFPVLLDIQKPDRILNVSDGVLTDLGRCRE